MAEGQFCAVQLTVENIGDEPQSMFADNQYAFDAKGRKFSANSMASMADESSQVLWEETNPGTAVKGKVYFDVPKGAKLSSLELPRLGVWRRHSPPLARRLKGMPRARRWCGRRHTAWCRAPDGRHARATIIRPR